MRRLIMDNKAYWLLAGYYGEGNAGDEMILRQLQQSISPILFLSGPRPRLNGAVPRFSPGKVLRSLAGARGLIVGGGELFQTRTSLKSFFYYLALPLLARFFRTPFHIIGLGFDPDLPGWARRVLAWALRPARSVIVRDESAFRFFVDHGIPAQKSPDLVWSWPCSPTPPGPSLARVLWILRFSPEEAEVESLANLFPSFPSAWEHGFLSFHPERDAQGLGRLRSRLGIFHRLEKGQSPEEILSVLSRYDVIVSMRYHGVILAALMGRPTVALADHGKVRDLAEELGVPVVPMAETIRTAWPDLLEKTFRAGPPSVGDRPFRVNPSVFCDDAPSLKVVK